MSEVWVLQIRDRGWRTVSEHGSEIEARRAWPTDYFGHINEFRIREKDRKPRKDCRDCKGTGQYKQYDGRGDSCMVWCECLND